MKVLYVIGKGRSGSTVLDRILGELDGFFSGGELWRLWDWGLARGTRCGCGEPVATCPVWSAAIAGLADEGTAAPDPADVVAWQQSIFSWRSVPRLLRHTRAGARSWPELDSYTATIARLYRALAGATGARVVVDSSKWPADPGVLGLVPGIEPRVVHLVRDPRAVAHSWQRVKRYDDPEEGPFEDGELPRFGPAHSGASWLARNLLAEAVRRRVPDGAWLTLTYEELMAEPRAAVQRIAALAGEHADVPFRGERTAVLGTHHMIGGNPAKEQAGDVELVPDDRWRSELGWLDRTVTTAVTMPLLPRYGYRVAAARR